MRVAAIPIILLGSIITVSLCEPLYARDYHAAAPSYLYLLDLAAENEGENVVKRGGLDMERRAYTYSGIPGNKRLPNYNFGLGKRARPYGFGLGKRSDDSENSINDASEKMLSDKRGPYDFGLGKRYIEDELERRLLPQRYNFGLGR